MLRFLYSLMLGLLATLLLPYFLWLGLVKGKYLGSVWERLGYGGGRWTRDGRPVIWLHAVSVGETRAAEPLVKAIETAYPDHRILLTHMTPTGRETGMQAFGERVERCYLPYDLPWAVSAFLKRFRPRVGVLLETELWPNLIHGCSRGCCVRDPNEAKRTRRVATVIGVAKPFFRVHRSAIPCIRRNTRTRKEQAA